MAIRNLKRQGFETFAPTISITIRKNKYFINRDVFIFPGYIFIGVDAQNSNWTKINNTLGVSKLLSFNNKPYEVHLDIILELKNRFKKNIEQTKKENLKKDDIIKFKSGPLVDLIVRIETIDPLKRIWFILEGMGGNMKLELKRNKEIKFVKV